jgi:DNA replication licensing factor MCM5
LTEEAAELLRNNYVSIREQMRTKQFGDEDATEKTVPITVRQLEAIVRIAEALAKMTLSSVVTETHVTEALRIFKVATLDSARTGAVSAPEGVLRPEVRAEVQRVEDALKRRLAIGSQASERRLIDHFLDENFSEFAIRQALMIMVRRGELHYRRQRKLVYRAQ